MAILMVRQNPFTKFSLENGPIRDHLICTTVNQITRPYLEQSDVSPFIELD